jgi:hypothetical protein
VIRPAVVIPVHKPRLTDAETASLRQVQAVLGHYPIVLAAPESLTPDAYAAVCSGIEVAKFEDFWFQGFRQHQRLMISRQFYHRFERYTHLLIYHLDAWVFRDELQYWCQQPFDYIGAPWRSGFDPQGQPQFHSAGNGGFSLRRVEAFLNTLAMFDHRRHKSSLDLFREVAVRSGMSRLKHLASLPLKLLGVGNSLRKFYDHYPYTEDKFWAQSAALANPSFRVAPVDIASCFSFEASPEFLWDKQGKTLPFGCHAWRYEQAFWCDTIGLPRDHDFRPHNDHGLPMFAH